MKFILEVTREDLDEGIRGFGLVCPLARACNRALNIQESEADDSLNFYIDGELFKISANYILYENITISEFIKRFDKEDYVRPFRKEIEIFPQEIELEE